RYTPGGGEIRLRAGGHAERGKAVLEVGDTGAGMVPDLLPRAFERFTKSPDSPGRGLGLAIARDLVRAHGGEITVESELGTGTRFRIEFPVE
ncbi:MAG: sensor histidine kinase, partial [Anaerolineales bacterium]